MEKLCSTKTTSQKEHKYMLKRKLLISKHMLSKEDIYLPLFVHWQICNTCKKYIIFKTNVDKRGCKITSFVYCWQIFNTHKTTHYFHHIKLIIITLVAPYVISSMFSSMSVLDGTARNWAFSNSADRHQLPEI